MIYVPPKALHTIPAILRERPRTPEGFPIPFVTAFEDIAGEKIEDFTKANMEQWNLCFTRNLCGICGTLLEETSYFIGSLFGLKSLEWYDPPMHRQCAAYAMRACPFLALSFTTYSDERKRERIDGSSIKPDYFIMVGVKTGEWHGVTLKSGARFYRLKDRRFVRSVKEYRTSSEMAADGPMGVPFSEVVGAPGLVQAPALSLEGTCTGRLDSSHESPIVNTVP